MTEKKRARRRRDRERIKNRWTRYARRMLGVREGSVDGSLIGRLASTHGTGFCNEACANRRASEGPPIRELRRTDPRAFGALLQALARDVLHEPDGEVT